MQEVPKAQTKQPNIKPIAIPIKADGEDVILDNEGEAGLRDPIGEQNKGPKITITLVEQNLHALGN